ncbi:MAG: hypothetical protein JWP00_4051 [Chloroflexi bacterium]|jgi:hypothetical protein|nr:hypothetical protein [Chloroflexota bacterium]
MTAAAAGGASSIAVAITGRSGIGRTANTTYLAKRGKRADEPFSPPTLTALRALDVFVFGLNTAQAFVVRTTIGTFVSINRHYVTISESKV